MKKVEAVIAQKYNRRFTKFGAVPEASLWFSEYRQLMRFKLIADVLDQNLMEKIFPSMILDAVMELYFLTF